MSHVGYNKTTMLDLTCSAFAVFTATVLSVPDFSSYSSHFQSMTSNSCQKTVNTRFEHIYVLRFLFFFFFKAYLSPIFPSPASFYGDGFVQLKATESSDHNTLRIRFRTSSTNGLLFLAAGQTDFFLLELHAGRLQVGTSMAPAHEYMCSSIHERTHAHMCIGLQYTQISVPDPARA